MHQKIQEKRAIDLTQLRASRNMVRGFTLIEVMVVVAIVAILTMIALPSYRGYVINTTRAQAKSQLTQVATRQEQYFLDNKSFALTLTDLGYGADPFLVENDGSEVVTASNETVYEISLSAATAISFTVAAKPLSQQATGDSKCGTLSLTNTGIRTQTGSSSDCW